MRRAVWGFHFHFHVHFSGWRGGGYGWRKPIRAFHFPHGGPLLHPDPRQVTFVISSVFTNNIQTMFMIITTTSYVCTHKKGGQAGIVTKRTIFSCCPGHRYCPLSGFTRITRYRPLSGITRITRFYPLSKYCKWRKGRTQAVASLSYNFFSKWVTQVLLTITVCR